MVTKTICRSFNKISCRVGFKKILAKKQLHNRHSSLTIKNSRYVTLALMFSVVSSSVAIASDDFWQSPLNTTINQVSTQDGDSKVSFNSYQQVNTEHVDTEQTSFALSQNLSANSSFTFEYSQGQEQRNYILGYTHKNLSVSLLNGSGEDYSELGGSYADINPYQFHAGLAQSYNYQGFALDYGFGKLGHVQLGRATLQADGLLNRQANYMEWSNDRVFARATQFSRGNETIGNGFDAGFALGNNKQVAYQTMQLDSGANINRIRFQFNGKATRQYWVDLSSQRNPLYQDSNDQRIMFSFKTAFGGNKLVNYAADTAADVESEGAKKNTALKRGVFIGVGVAAGIALASSGDERRDESTVRFASQNEAAFDVLNRVNPLSVAENREYGGWVVLNQDGSFSPTDTVTGGPSSVTIPGSLIPNGTRATASIHTHAAFDPRFDNENFSPTDLASDRRSMTDGYLGTPGGQFKLHIVQTGEIVTLGTIAN